MNESKSGRFTGVDMALYRFFQKVLPAEDLNAHFGGVVTGLRLAIAHPEWAAAFVALSTSPDGTAAFQELVEAVPMTYEAQR